MAEGMGALGVETMRRAVVKAKGTGRKGKVQAPCRHVRVNRDGEAHGHGVLVDEYTDRGAVGA